MKWEIIATVAELIGAGGVIASLIYLSFQIRQSTKVARAETTKDIYLASRAAILEIAANENLAEIYSDIRDLPDTKYARRHALYQSFFRLYELQLNLANQGLLDEDISNSFDLIMRMWVNTKHFPTYWKLVRGEFNDTFASYVDEQAKLASIKL
jgi:hypothetical protein